MHSRSYPLPASIVPEIPVPVNGLSSSHDKMDFPGASTSLAHKRRSDHCGMNRNSDGLAFPPHFALKEYYLDDGLTSTTVPASGPEPAFACVGPCSCGGFKSWGMSV